MTLFVEIVRTIPPGPESEEGMPRYRLDGEFASMDDANAAAVDHLNSLGLPPGGAHYRICNEKGEDIVSTQARDGGIGVGNA